MGDFRRGETLSSYFVASVRKSFLHLGAATDVSRTSSAHLPPSSDLHQQMNVGCRRQQQTRVSNCMSNMLRLGGRLTNWSPKIRSSCAVKNMSTAWTYLFGAPVVIAFHFRTFTVTTCTETEHIYPAVSYPDC